MNKSRKRPASRKGKKQPAYPAYGSLRERLTVGQLRKLLASKNSKAQVYVNIGGPQISVTAVTFYKKGHQGKPTIILDVNGSELPKPQPLETAGQFMDKIAALADEYARKCRDQKIK